MFMLLGFVVGFAILFGCLWLVDYIGYRRGFGGAHPLSPAMAYAALFGAAVTLTLMIVGGSIDHARQPTIAIEDPTNDRK